MVVSEYKCFSCGHAVGLDYLKKKVRCPYCGSRILFKARDAVTKVKAK